VELPYTLPQDFTLFLLLAEKTTDICVENLTGSPGTVEWL
jgi:hypothetical protein